ncbi:MAG: ribosome small subunit-dependent GTPase A, partial [Bacteroidales bacterium]
MESLYQYGWSVYIEKSNYSEQTDLENTGRVISVKGNIYEIITLKGIRKAELLGRLLFSFQKWEQPKVGDWVEWIDYGEAAIISDVLPRYNQFYRKTAGKEAEKQVMAVNIDKVVIIQGLDNDFNLNRIERYLVQIATCGIKAVVILNKSDLIEDEAVYRKEIQRLQRDTPVYFCSVKNGSGLEIIQREVFVSGSTSLLVGSSGVGKTSLLNTLTKSGRKTKEISESTGKGKHTTTTRDMILLDNGGIVIDSPGMREFGLGFDEEASFEEQYPAISKYAKDCKFSDCTH